VTGKFKRNASPEILLAANPFSLFFFWLHKHDFLNPHSTTVLDPNKQNLPAEIFEDGEGVRRIEFLPQRVGDHEIHINVNSVDINGSPFT
jgi:hypothetical protein